MVRVKLIWPTRSIFSPWGDPSSGISGLARRHAFFLVPHHHPSTVFVAWTSSTPTPLHLVWSASVCAAIVKRGLHSCGPSPSAPRRNYLLHRTEYTNGIFVCSVCDLVARRSVPFRSVVAGPPSPCRRPWLSKRGAYLGLRSEKLKQLQLRLSHSAGRAWNCSSPRSINLRVRGSWGHVL